MRQAVRDYAEYLASAEWKQRRAGALHRASHRCQSPSCPDARLRSLTDEELRFVRHYRLEVHHLSYARLGNEHPDDLIVLCPQCHAAVHGVEHFDAPNSIATAVEAVVRQMARANDDRNAA